MIVTGLTNGGDQIKSRQGEILGRRQDKIQSRSDYPVDFPKGIWGATGVLLHDHYPTICGGEDESWNIIKDCYSMHYISRPTIQQWEQWKHDVNWEQWKLRGSMTEARHFSVSISLNSSSFWVTGGLSNLGDLISTEILTINEYGTSLNAEIGPTLPESSYGHCLVALTDTTTMALGGHFDKTTHIYDWVISQWKKGPQLNTGDRYYPGCGLLKDQSTGKE